VIVVWLVSFGLLYGLVLRPSVGSDYLNSFHNDYFFPLLHDWAGVRRAGALLYEFLRLGFGFTLVALLWGAITLVWGLIDLPWRHRWLLLPLLLVVGASAFKFYSLIDRLILFVLPGMWLLSSLVAQRAYQWLSGGRSLLMVATLLMLGGSNIVFNYFQPVTFSDGRRLAQLTTNEQDYSVKRSAVPVVDYYRRIHPATRVGEAFVEASNELRPLMLYDVTTAAGTRNRIRQDSMRAEARGCKVIREELYRAGVLRLRCPVRNSDP
jgi:hypothetical protein